MPQVTLTAASGNWVAPNGIAPGSTVELYGDGGGASDTSSAFYGSGGGGGGYTTTTMNFTGGNSYSYTVGQGGAGGASLNANGTAGSGTTINGASASGGHGGGAQSGGTGGAGSTHNGGNGSAGSASTKGAGGGCAGPTGVGGNASGGTGGTAGGGLAGAGGNTGVAGHAQGGGGGANSSFSGSSFAGAAGIIVITYTLLPFTAGAGVRRAPVAAVMTQAPRRRQNTDMPTPAVPGIVWDVPRFPERSPAVVLWHRGRGQAPTGWPVPVQPPERMQYIRRFSKPPYPLPVEFRVPPTAFPTPPYVPAEVPNVGERRPQKYQWFRRSTVRMPILVPQPPVPNSVRRFQKYQWFRRGIVPPTGLPVPVQPPTVPGPYGIRRIQKYQWFRRATTQTGWPVPVQPPSVPNVGVTQRRFRPQMRRKANISDTFTPQVFVQPPWSSWVYLRRTQKYQWFRRANIVRGLPQPPYVPAEVPNVGERRPQKLQWYRRSVIRTPVPLPQPPAPNAIRRPQKYQWFRRGNVPPTGWPIPVQPPERMQYVRRWSRPLWPRRSVIETPVPIPQPPVPTSERRLQKYQWFRRGNAQPNTGLPVPVQPPFNPTSVRRQSRITFRRKGQTQLPYILIVQPPWSPWKNYRRWSMPPWPRRGRTNIATFPGVQLSQGYVPLTLQTFTYTPGGGGLDLAGVDLTLFPLNYSGYTFWNAYGDVIFVVYNGTPSTVGVQPVARQTVELQYPVLPTYQVPAGATQVFGPFPVSDFTIPNGVLESGILWSGVYTGPFVGAPTINVPPEYMCVNVSTSFSGVYAAAFRMVPAPPTGHTGPYDLLGARLRKAIADLEERLNSEPGELHPGEESPGA